MFPDLKNYIYGLQKFVTTVYFMLLSYIEKLTRTTGDQYVATSSWQHWSPVSWYTTTAMCACIDKLLKYYRPAASLSESTFRLSRYNWLHSFRCAARCLKRQISCQNKCYSIHTAVTIAPFTGEVQTRHEY